MIRIDDILDRVAHNNPSADIGLVRRAYMFAALHYQGKEVPTGEPYLVQPLETAAKLAERKLDVTVVSAGFLCRIIEDTLIEPEDLLSYFGEEVTKIVIESANPADYKHISADSRVEIVKLMTILSLGLDT